MLTPIIFDNSETFSSEFASIAKDDFLGIAPSPLIADQYREIAGLYCSKNIDVITIFKLVQDLLSRDENFKAERLCNKSKLLLSLATLWKFYIPKLGYSDFQQAFKIFTELRGHFLTSDYLEQILSDFRPEISNAVVLFWQFLSNTNLIDEHGAYGEIATQLRTIGHPTHENHKALNIAFFGFKHFTPIQIVFIKSLAIKNNVYVFIPKLVYENRKATDWCSWLFHNDKMKKVESKTQINCRLIKFSKNEYFKILMEIKNEINDANVIFGKKSLEKSDIGFFPDNSYFKVSTDIYLNDIKSLGNEISQTNFKKLSEHVTAQKLLNDLEVDLKRYCAEKSIESLRKIKVILQAIIKINEWVSLSEKNNIIDYEILKIIFESIELDSPRNYIIPLVHGENVGEIESFSGIENNFANNKQILVLSAAFGSVVSSGSYLPESVISILSTIGPVRSSELDVKFIIFWMELFLRNNKNILLVEEKLLDENFSWKKIFLNIELVFDSLHGGSRAKSIKDILHKKIYKKVKDLNFSPTKLQKYFDCPRKFYFSELEKVSVQRVSEYKIEKYEIGEIEHRIIQQYIENNSSYSKSKVEEMAFKEFENYINKRGKKINIFPAEITMLELIDFSINGIKALLDLKEKLSINKFIFEYELKEVDCGRSFYGRADCYFEFNGAFGLLDFKRSKASIPSQGELDDFKKFQLWFYLLRLSHNRKPLVFGHLCLDDLGDSQIYLNETDYEKIEVSWCKLKNKSYFEIEKKMQDYKIFEQDLVTKMMSDEKFNAVPMNNGVCDFCDLAVICTRGVNVD